jgi:hypothetical protein
MTTAHNRLLQPLPSGSLDIIGDVHGEIEPLRNLLKLLGYDEHGNHRHDRTLVFVGDLADRGPDSPAVVSLVRALVNRGRALCVMGNHELNVVREDCKDGNGWAFEDNHDRVKGKYSHSIDATAAEREEMREFFARLPLALYRHDLRVVHACWSREALDRIATASANHVASTFEHFEAQVEEQIEKTGHSAASHEERLQHDLTDASAAPPLLRATGRLDEMRQMGNPLRVVTSGVERLAIKPFFSSGKWRMVDRIAWWHEYEDEVPVVVGHYWRWPTQVDRSAFEKGGPDLFANTRPTDWLGANQNVFCVDFSIGRRFRERELGRPLGSCSKLAALRWPERELVFDTGERYETAAR